MSGINLARLHEDMGRLADTFSDDAYVDLSAGVAPNRPAASAEAGLDLK